jgi:hypothetical protein
MTNTTTTTALTLSEMKAQVNKKKAVKAVKATTKAAAPKAKAPVKVSTDKAKKPAKEPKPKAVKIPFETYEAAIAKLVKVKLEETTRNKKTIKVGTNKALTLESLPERKELVIKVNGKVACEIYPGKKGYKFCVKLDREVNIPKDATVKNHEKAKAPWKDIIVAAPDTFIAQFVA